MSAAEGEERYQRFRALTDVLGEVGREIGSAMELGGILKTVLGAMHSLVDFDGGMVLLLGEDGIRVAVSDPALPEHLRELRVPRRSGIAGQVIASGRSAIVDDLRVDPRLDPSLAPAVEQVGIVSVLAVPLLSMGEPVGTLQVNSGRPNAFDDDDRVILESLATHVAGAISSARTYSMVADLETMKSDFIARVSHELRTPITIMAGFVNTLLVNDHQLEGAERRQMLERIDTATARLTGLIDDLLTLARLEAGVVTTRMEPVQVESLLEEVRRQSRQPESVRVECGESMTLRTDADHLRRALGMLVDNALKYAGSCRLMAGARTIQVIDDGPGIPEEQRSRVFERFTRANENTTVPGMGLGLPMARTLAAAAGADLVLGTPENGVGTRMIVSFW